MGLTVGQAIGVGVAVGFVGALALVAVLLFIPTEASDPSYYITSTPADDPARLALEPPQEVVIDRRPDAVKYIVRHFPVRMDPLQSLPEVAESVAFERWISSYTETYFDSHRGEQPLVPESLFDEDKLVCLAGEPVNGGTWSASISDVVTRTSAIKCFLAQIMFKRMDPKCPPQEGLLPPEISSCYQFVYPPHENPAWEDFAGLWRESMHLLLRGPLSLRVPPRPFDDDDPRKERTVAMVPAILDALHLDALRNDGHCNERPKASMAGILEEAANSALVLLAQAAEWQAVWAAFEPGFIIFPEVRLVWDGYIQFSRPAVVDADLTWPMPSENDQQPDDDNRHPEVDAGDQPAPDAGKLPSLEGGRPVTLEVNQGHVPNITNQ